MPRPLTGYVAVVSAAVLLAVVGIVVVARPRPMSASPVGDHETAPAAGARPSLPDAPPSGAANATPPPRLPAKHEPPGPAVFSPPPRRPVALDEPSLMNKLRALEATDPRLTLQLAREGNRRFPDSADAPERAWMAVKALANMENFKAARDEARVMVKRYPGTSWSLDVQRHLLSNPLDD